VEETNFEYANPNPASLMQSLRAFGYDVSTAVADLIDNSITARAKRIDIVFEWNDGNPWISIADDGYGMSEDELFEAMKTGSKNPLDSRSKNDLGRFGLGLKTASFSQCKRLTVASKKNNLLTGIDDFLKKANKAGVSYVLSPDASRKFNAQLKSPSEKGNLQIISFSSLSVDEDEMNYLKESEGYIFQRSTDGQTGVPGSFSDKLGEKIDAIKTAGIKTPVVVGFGVSQPSHFKMIFDLNADGAVIGSALFKHILNKDLDEYLEQFKGWYE